ncbi:MAG: hypothetical protein KAS36_11170 [Anaerolineales bacterium]|nr:hypothetical protein [Anaerolineales bacterium]
MMSTEQELTRSAEEKKYIDAIFWGGAFLWAGLVFGADALSYLPQIGDSIDWSWVFLGMGVYGLLLDVIRLVSTGLSNPTAWDWSWTFIFLVIGAAGFLSVGVPWWLFLIILGTVILGRALFRRD